MLVGLTPLLNSSNISILRCDQRYGTLLSVRNWPAILCQRRISQVIGNGLGNPLPIRQRKSLLSGRAQCTILRHSQ
jgi:hypothetical protein